MQSAEEWGDCNDVGRVDTTGPSSVVGPEEVPQASPEGLRTNLSVSRLM